MRKLCLQATCLLLQTRPASASDLLAPTGATLTVPTGTLRAAYIVTNLAHATHGPTSTATAVIPPPKPTEPAPTQPAPPWPTRPAAR